MSTPSPRPLLPKGLIPVIGHIVSAPLPVFSTLADASSFAAEQFAADVVAGSAIFVEMPFGPVVVCRSGAVREAEYIGRSDGFTWVVFA